MKSSAIPCLECPFTTEGMVIVSEDGQETDRLAMSSEDGSLMITGTGECGASARIISAEEIEEKAPEMSQAIRECRGRIDEDIAIVEYGSWLGKLGMCKVLALPAACGAMTQAKTERFLEQLTTKETTHNHGSNSNCKCT